MTRTPKLNLFAQRLHNQHISSEPLARVEDVVRLLCGVQSQDYPGAKWSIGQRVLDCLDSDVDRALSEGRILRTHVLRPTWHFVLPDDIKWMTKLSAPKVHALMSYQARRDNIDAPLFARAEKVICKALEGGVHLTRKEVSVVLGRAGIEAKGVRLAHLLMHAELESLICSGVMRAKQQTYALLDERAPLSRTLDRDDALAELAFRFITGHAPATLKQLAWWADLTLADARKGIESVRAGLSSRVIGGVEWFCVRDDVPPPAPGSAYLIPEYDESLTALATLDLQDIPPGLAKKSWRDIFFRPIIIGGKRAGTWKREPGSKQVSLVLNLFRPLTGREKKAIDGGAARYARFIGRPVVIR